MAYGRSIAIDGADQALEVFGLREIKQHGMILGCSAALKQGYANMCVYSGRGHSSFEIVPGDMVRAGACDEQAAGL